MILCVRVQSVTNPGLGGGFVAITVAPDAKSVTVSWQVNPRAALVREQDAGGAKPRCPSLFLI